VEVLQAIEGRRAINYFDPEREIPVETLKKLLETANLAPSSFNLQPWEVIVVQSPEKKKVLRECAFNQPKVEEASVVLIMIADPGAVEKNWEWVLDDRFKLGYLKTEEQKERARQMMVQLYGEADSLRRKIFAVKNTAFYAMALMIAARGLGLETHPMDGFDEKAVKDAFDIPEEKIVPLIVAVGYKRPGVTLLPRPKRRSLEEFVTFV